MPLNRTLTGTLLAMLVAAGGADAAFRATLSNTVGPGLTPGHGSNEYVVRIDWNQNQANGQDVAWIGHSFSSFCIQRNQDVYFGGTYDYNTRSLANSPVPGAAMGAAKADLIKRLWAAERSTLGMDNHRNAAFQEAIWKILDANYVVDAVVQGLVTTFLAAAQTETTRANLVALTSWNYQDQIVELKSGWMVNPDGEVVPTPAPPAVILLLTGLFPFAAMVRRARRPVVG